jgi:hypothetical protein
MRRPRGETAANWWRQRQWQQQLQRRCHCWGLASLAFVVVGSKSHQGGGIQSDSAFTVTVGVWPSSNCQAHQEDNNQLTKTIAKVICVVYCVAMGGGWQGERGRRVPSPFKKLSKIHKVGFKKLAEKKKKAIWEIKFGLFEKMEWW